MISTLERPMDILDLGICGFHQYHLQAPVHLTFASQNLCRMLGLEPSDLLSSQEDRYAAYIHPDDRASYREFLQQAAASPCSKTLQYRLLAKNGDILSVCDTMTSQLTEDGSMVGNSVLTELPHPQRASAYLAALQDVYDKIFRYDLSKSTVTCIHCKQNSRLQWVQNIPMAIDAATEKWITSTVIPEDRPRLRAFFQDCLGCSPSKAHDRPVSITYSATSSSGLVLRYRGMFLKLDADARLYCCRCLSPQEVCDQQKHDKLERLLQSFTEGIAAFEVIGEYVTPLYASDNVCQFFGYDREEWLSLMEKKTPIPDFVSRCEVDLDAFRSLLASGRGDFTYTDMQAGRKRKMHAVCSSPDPDGTRFVMLYHEGSERSSQEPLVYIRTFGYFDVFIGDDPIPFRNQRSKELLALLVDRKGGYVSSQEAIGSLWEDEPVSPVTLARYRKVALRLKNTLEDYGISEIMECVDGKRRIVPAKVRCDLYDYLSDTAAHASLFKGSYLTNYSWSEYTLAELTAGSI